MGQGRVQAFSAGSAPTGQVHPLAHAILQRHNLPTGSARSKSWDEFLGQNFDWVITVCDAAAGQACPIYLGTAQKLHWSTPDPAAITGGLAAQEAAFESVFAQLQKRIAEFLNQALSLH